MYWTSRYRSQYSLSPSAETNGAEYGWLSSTPYAIISEFQSLVVRGRVFKEPL